MKNTNSKMLLIPRSFNKTSVRSSFSVKFRIMLKLLWRFCVVVYFSVLGLAGCTHPTFDKTREYTLEPCAILSGHKGYVTSLVFLNQERLASSSLDCMVKIWNLKSRTELYTLCESKSQVTSLALAPDGNTLASGTLQDGVTCWRKVPGKSDQFLLQQKINTWQDVRVLVFSADNQTLAIGEGFGDACVHLYDINTKNHQTIIQKGPREFIESLAFSPDNKKLVATTGSNTILFYDLSDHTLKMSITGHTTISGSEGIFCVAFSPDGKSVATGGVDQTVRVWDVNSGKESFALVGHTQTVKSVSFSPDCRLLASGSGEGYLEAGELKIWDLTLHKELVGFPAHTKPIRVVSFSPDGKLLATGSEDQTVKLWKTPELQKD